jgi:hypothetical protein
MLKQKILYELDEFLDIPQFERIIHHKIEELKEYLKDEIDYYLDLKGYFKKIAYGEMRVFEGSIDNLENNRTYSYYFQLTKEKDGYWNVSKIEPLPSPEYGADDIIPKEIIEYIQTEKCFLGKIQTINDLSFPTLNRYRCDLNYVFYSDYLVLGAIQIRGIEKR